MKEEEDDPNEDKALQRKVLDHIQNSDAQLQAMRQTIIQLSAIVESLQQTFKAIEMKKRLYHLDLKRSLSGME